MSRGRGYRYAIEWIAEMDEAAETDVEHIRGMATVVMVADMFDKDPMDVARAVARRRLANVLTGGS